MPRPHPTLSRAGRAVVAAALLSVGPARPAEPAPAAPTGLAPAPRIHAHAHGEPATRARHHVMVMAAPGVAARGGGFVATGIGYEYRLPAFGDALGLGGMTEWMLGSGHGHQMLMASASLHPAGGLLLQASVGATHRHERAGSTAGSTGHMKTSPVARLTAGYDVHAGGIMLTPHVNADLGDRATRAVSAGLCAGMMF